MFKAESFLDIEGIGVSVGSSYINSACRHREKHRDSLVPLPLWHIRGDLDALEVVLDGCNKSVELKVEA